MTAELRAEMDDARPTSPTPAQGSALGAAFVPRLTLACQARNVRAFVTHDRLTITVRPGTPEHRFTDAELAAIGEAWDDPDVRRPVLAVLVVEMLPANEFDAATGRAGETEWAVALAAADHDIDTAFTAAEAAYAQRPTLTEVALALAAQDGSPLADRPELIARAAVELAAARPDADPDDVLVWAARYL